VVSARKYTTATATATAADATYVPIIPPVIPIMVSNIVTGTGIEFTKKSLHKKYPIICATASKYKENLRIGQNKLYAT
jgi:hypothetical protein